ncbi:MAG TPA: DUF1003 domain-containing protein [Caulobacteraceae bacterium]|jgi:uncharacterized membrane protein
MDDAAPPPPQKTLAEVRAGNPPLRNVHDDVQSSLTGLDKLALFITNHVGTMGFFLIILTWTVIWLGLNFFSPWKFDPPMGFVFYLFISNVIQILLMPLIMVGQNLQGRHSEARAQHDLEVNVKAEEEIEVILQHLQYQNDMLTKMVIKLGVDVQEAIAKS